MNIILRAAPILGLLILLISGCEKDPGSQPSGVRFLRGEGVFITQEGNFATGNGVLSYYNFVLDSLYEGVYEERNGIVVGNVLQGAFFEGNDAYLIVNGSGIIIKFDPATGNQLDIIPNLPSPNDFLIYNERDAFVSDLFGPYLYKINLLTGLRSDSLFTGGGTGEIEILEDQLFITKLSDFGASPSTSLIVADPENLEILDTIMVGYNPTSVLSDADGKLWVACNGNSFEGRFGSLHRIDPGSHEVMATLPFPDLNTSYAARLAINDDGTQLFFLKGDVFRIAIDDPAFPAEPIIPAEGRSLYALGIRPGNGDIYVGVEDFITESKILIFDGEGSKRRELDSQIGVNNFYFY